MGGQTAVSLHLNPGLWENTAMLRTTLRKGHPFRREAGGRQVPTNIDHSTRELPLGATFSSASIQPSPGAVQPQDIFINVSPGMAIFDKTVCVIG